MVDERHIIELATSGDLNALEQLLLSYHLPLENYIRRRMPDELSRSIDPDDVIQDTFFEAFRLIRSFRPDGEGAMLRWLTTIANHHMIDLLRSHRAVKHGSGKLVDLTEDQVTNLLSELAVYRRTPSRSAAAHEVMAAVEQAVAGLKEDYRAVITYRHLQGLTVTETASAMGCDHATIHLLCCRALKALRKDIKSISNFL